MKVLVDPDTGELVEVLPADVHGVEPYDYADAKRAVFSQTRETRAAERELLEAINRKAKADGEAKRVAAIATIEARKDHPATLAKTIAEGTADVVAATEEKTAAEELVKAAHARLRLCSEDRASLHRLIEWSMKADPDGFGR